MDSIENQLSIYRKPMILLKRQAVRPSKDLLHGREGPLGTTDHIHQWLHSRDLRVPGGFGWQKPFKKNHWNNLKKTCFWHVCWKERKRNHVKMYNTVNVRKLAISVSNCGFHPEIPPGTVEVSSPIGSRVCKQCLITHLFSQVVHISPDCSGMLGKKCHQKKSLHYLRRTSGHLGTRTAQTSLAHQRNLSVAMIESCWSQDKKKKKKTSTQMDLVSSQQVQLVILYGFMESKCDQNIFWLWKYDQVHNGCSQFDICILRQHN